MDRVQATGKIRKRKAENQDNERLSKRLSLLNLERNGQKLYVPIEQPSTPPSQSTKTTANPQTADNDVMQLDDSKHKVYIYNLDDELSDSDTSDDGRLVFLSDIDKHLRDTRIPPSILANKEGELAGHNQQMVLYSVPTSLTVPEEKDSVRKAIIETRARARAKQDQNRESSTREAQTQPAVTGSPAVSTAGFSYGMTGRDLASSGHEQLEEDPDSMDLD
ncbi:hypothetical protein BP6252_07140 [Coleophoma cylindrospora]|uniref:Uncharacterized protein n=1 Tax=Coleophoma cylindrospora TaxID=1849047 RepID=A0A3D8RGP3_9HELO|nr:hypothetical protein BP6252_07140 [Coleophoma cylindrospora]